MRLASIESMLPSITVSIPYRCNETCYGRFVAFLLFDVSIPYRCNETLHPVAACLVGALFQFLIGAMRLKKVWNCESSAMAFQFLIGAMRHQGYASTLCVSICFNSL